MKRAIYLGILKILLVIHGHLYTLISKIAVRWNEGIHPKHDILKYEMWFVDKLTDTDKVLDIGCHSGSMCFLMAKKAESVVGIEIDKTKYQKAVRDNNYSNLHFVNADATTWTSNDQFTVITLSNVLEHIEHRREFLRKILQNYNPTKMLIRVPLITRDWISVLKKDLNLDYRLDPTHFTEYRENEIRSEIEEVGLFINEMKISFGEIFIECSKENRNV